MTLANQTLDRLDRLTPKERACLLLVGRRRSSKEIAAELGIAKTSVDTYCNRARSKLGVSDRYEAARLVVAHGAPVRETMAVSARPSPNPGFSRSQAAAVRGSRRTQILLLLAAALFALLAIGSFISGMGALDDIRQQTARANAARAHLPSPP